MKKNYLSWAVIALSVIATAVAGSLITSGGMAWYKTLKLPALAPDGSVIGSVWTVIFILAALSVWLFWRNRFASDDHRLITGLFIANAFLNVGWSLVFFGAHLLGPAVAEMVILNLVNLALILFLWPVSRLASVLLWPYFIWVSFATYLAFSIWRLNG